MTGKFVIKLRFQNAISSADACRLGGVKIGLGLTGKLGRAWVVHGMHGMHGIHGWMMG